MKNKISRAHHEKIVDEVRRESSMKAAQNGRVSGFRLAADHVLEIASKHFKNCKDEFAKELRSVSRELRERATDMERRAFDAAQAPKL